MCYKLLMLNVNIVYVLCVFLLPTFKHIAKFNVLGCKDDFQLVCDKYILNIKIDITLVLN
jgi:hypothetical protein